MNGCVYQTADKQCMKFTDKVRNTMSWCVGDNPCEFRKPSNADRIRAMTNKELANMWCVYVDCGECPNRIECSMTCQDCLRFALKWLEQECET